MATEGATGGGDRDVGVQCYDAVNDQCRTDEWERDCGLESVVDSSAIIVY